MYEGLTSPGDVEILAHRIYDAFAQPFELAGTQLIVSASVGMAFAGPGEEITNELLFRADMAMYQVERRTGGERKIIDIRDALLIMDDRSLEADLRLSLANHEFHVAYQPIVSMQTQRIEGVEALLRWTHASRGPVPPATMVPVAERTGLIGEIGTWVLEQSCRDHTSWRHGHPNTALDLSVNVSVRQLLSPAYYESVADVLERTEMDPTSNATMCTTSAATIHRGTSSAARCPPPRSPLCWTRRCSISPCTFRLQLNSRCSKNQQRPSPADTFPPIQASNGIAGFRRCPTRCW